ncbi:uncharacterized protein BN811_01038 [Clostridium sp. CAG:921]|nr:uncharacterized protein BN811_01038 [Clostridium sp. CAG:921]
MENKKILYVATYDKVIMDIYLPYIIALKNIGFNIYVATSEDGDIPYITKKFKYEFDVSTLSVTNFEVIKAVKSMREMLNVEEFDFIHTHGLNASFITAMAATNIRKNGKTKIIYTADGLSFDSNSSKSSYALYYSIEKLLAKNIDYMITVNKEDYEFAKDDFKNCKVYYIDGYGIKKEEVDIDVSDELEEKLRKELMLKDDQKLILNVGDYTKENNQEYLLKAMSIIKDKTRNVKIVFVGKDKLNGKLKKLASDYDISNNVLFLDLNKKQTALIYAISDLYIDVSLQKNYPYDIIVAMINYLPIISTKVRGNVDLIKNNVTGYLIDNNDVHDLCKKIMILLQNEQVCDNFIENYDDLYEDYLYENVTDQMCKIYNEIVK